jgi:hypothetical protein
VLLAITAILVIAAVVALLVWVAPLATGGVGAEDAVQKAGAAVFPEEKRFYPLPHGKMAPAVIDTDGLYYPLPHGKVAPHA